MTPKKKAGRPEFIPTAVQRRKVAIWSGGGMSHSEVATALGVARATLEKHFADELSAGACEKRGAVLMAQYKSALDGNVAAQKAYLAAGEPRSAIPPAAGNEKPAPMGKKAQADADAGTASHGTDWETLLPGSAAVQ